MSESDKTDDNPIADVHEVNARLRAVLDAAVDGIVTIDEEGIIESANPAFSNIFGYDPAEIVGVDIKILMAEAYRGEFDRRLQNLLEQGEYKTIGTGGEAVGLRKDRSVFPIELAFNEVRVPGCRLFAGIIRDISDQKRIEEALRLSEERFSKAFRSSPDALMLARANGVIFEVNEGFERIFGYTRDEAIGSTAGELGLFLVEGDRLHVRSLFEEDGRLVDHEIDLQTKSGECRHTSLSVEGITVQGEPCLLVIFRDETERRIAEQKLRESENRYRAIFELSAVGQAEVEAETRKFLSVNRRYCAITGYSQEELLKLKVADVTHPDDRAYDEERFDRTLSNLQMEHVSEKRYLRKDGSVRWVDVRGRLMRDADGAPHRIVEIISDITDRRLAENALRDSERALRSLNETLEQRVAQRTDELIRANQVLEQRNRALRDFANVASHDLREPLRKIQTFADLIEEEYGAGMGEGRAYLERMRAVAERMTDLLNDLRSFSRLGSGFSPFVRTELNEIIQEVISDLEPRVKETGAVLDIGDLPAVYGIRSHLRQLFQNVITNALKFRKKDVEPHVQIYSDEPTEPGTVRIIVSDQGIGFDPAYAERIFGPFQRLHRRTAYEGTGMGLAICRRIVEHHGGTMTAESRPGEGARFIITLPTFREITADDEGADAESVEREDHWG
jgi:PAS domain S-box-containing protein